MGGASLFLQIYVFNAVLRHHPNRAYYLLCRGGGGGFTDKNRAKVGKSSIVLAE
jgi:hypothetical protein